MSLRVTVVLVLVLSACSVANAPEPQEPISPTAIVTAWTDSTTCDADSDCEAVEFGCGGGHTMCTSDPDSYKDRVSTCDIVEQHPSEEGYACGCVASKCVWKK